MSHASRLRTRLWLPVLPSICLACGALCGAQEAAGGTVLHLHGSVVNGVTGKPIARALVVSGDQRVAVMTDNQGQFAVDLTLRTPPQAGFGGVQSFIGLIARKPGFSQAVEPTIVPLNEAPAGKNLEMKLMPALSIGGQVTANGEPAGNVVVSLLQRRAEDGQPVWLQRSGEQTDSRGEFRFSGLEPGEYTVVTMEWRGDEPLPPRQQMLQGIAVEYPPDFAGDAGSFDAATKLRLRDGDATHLELHLHAAKYYPVRIPVAGSSGGVGISVGGYGAGGASFSGLALDYNNRDHAVEGALPDGDYTLLLSRYGDRPSFAEVPIHIADAPFQSAPVAFVPGLSIPVRVEKQFTQPENASPQAEAQSGGEPQSQPAVQMYLRPLSMTGPGANSSRPGSNGELELDGVAPGQYTVQTIAFRGYVASLTSGGVDLLQHPLVVSPGGRAEPIDVVLRDDTGSVTGTVTPKNDSRPLPYTTLLALIPEDGAGRVTQGFAGRDGKFQVPNVAPGSYRILAFPGNFDPQIAYRDPKSLAAWDGKGSTVTVTAGAAAQVDVPLLDEAEAQPE